MNILTRSGRKKAGMKPPSPFFNPTKKPRLDDTAVTPSQQKNKSNPDNDNNNSRRGKRVQQGRSQSTTGGGGEGDGDVWVQCDKCGKWRRVESISNGSEEWFCHMNTSPTHRSCDSNEEAWQLPNGLIYTYKGLVPGQLVWAKLQSYPPWPAIVTPDPYTDCNHKEESKEGCIYHVEFLGRQRSHSWLPEEMVEPYRPSSCSIGSIFTPGTNKVSLRLQQAIKEAGTLQGLTNEQRLGACQYTPSKIGPKQSKKTIKEVKSNVHKTKDPQALPNISNSLLRVPPVTMATGLGPIAMATGLQVLQMLGLTLDNNNDTPTTSDKCTTVRPDNVLVNNAISLKSQGIIRTKSVQRKSSTSTDKGSRSERKRKKTITSPVSSNITHYFQPRDYESHHSMEEDSDMIGQHSVTDTPVTDNTNMDQVVPDDVISLDTLVCEAQNDLTHMETLLDTLNMCYHPSPKGDMDIQSLLYELENVEDVIDSLV